MKSRNSACAIVALPAGSIMNNGHIFVGRNCAAPTLRRLFFNTFGAFPARYITRAWATSFRKTGFSVHTLTVEEGGLGVGVVRFLGACLQCGLLNTRYAGGKCNKQIDATMVRLCVLMVEGIVMGGGGEGGEV